MYLKIPLLGMLSLLVTVLSPVCLSDISPARSFTKIIQIGRGTIENIEWQPNGDRLLVNTPQGAWLYSSTLTDVAALPDVRYAAYSPDGRQIAGIENRNAVVLWDAAAFEHRATLYTHLADIKALAWSPDGAHLATLDNDGLIVIDTLATQELKAVHMPAGDAILWSTAGTYLAAEGQHIEVWEAASGKSVFKATGCDPCWHILWRNDTQLLHHIDIVDYADATLWDVTTGQATGRLPTGVDFAFDHNGGYVVVSRDIGLLNTPYLTVLATVDAMLEKQVPYIGLSNFTSAIAWQHSDKQVALGMSNEDGTAKIGVYGPVWTGHPAALLHVPHDSIRQIAWNSDDTRLAATGEGWLLIWNVTEPIVTAESTRHGEITDEALVWSSDSRWIATGDTMNQVRLWDAASGEPVNVLRGAQGKVEQFAWQPGGTWLVARAGGRYYDEAVYPRVYLWDTSRLAPGNRPDIVLPAAADIAWRPDGQALALLYGGQLKIYDIHTRTISLDIVTDYRETGALRWTPDGSRVMFSLAGSFDRAEVVVNPVNGTQETLTGKGDGIRTWTTTGEWIAASSRGQEHGMSWDVNPFLTLTTLYAPSGRATIDAPLTLDVMTAPVESYHAVFNASGSAIAAVDDRGTAAVWTLPDGKRRLTFDNASQVIWNHSGTQLLVIAPDAGVRVLDAYSGEILALLSRPVSLYSPALSWSPDDTRIVYASSGTLTIWQQP